MNFLTKKIVNLPFIFCLFVLCLLGPAKLLAFNNYVDGNNSSNADSDYLSTTQIISEIEKNLLFDDDEKDQINFYKKKDRSNYVLTKSKTPEEKEEKDSEDDPIQISVRNSSTDTLNISRQQKLAYNSLLSGQYEVAIEIYKQILKSNPRDTYAKFALASAYQKIGQFKQAKALYYQLLKENPENREEIISNILAIITEESPKEAIYLLDRLAKQNPQSDYIMAQAAYAYNKAGEEEKAIYYLKRALNINPKNEYRFNIAVIYDKMESYQEAIRNYTEVLNNYDETTDSSIPHLQVQNRIKVIKNKFYQQ